MKFGRLDPMVLLLWWVYRTQRTHEKNLTSALFLNTHSLVHCDFFIWFSFFFFFYFLLLKEQNPRTDVENVEIDGK